MLTVVAILLLGITILLVIMFFKEVFIEELWLALSFFFGAGFLACIICIAFDIATIGTSYTLDQKIEMYEAENSAIEERIDTIVDAYMVYESETFEKYKPQKNEDVMTLVSLFPELKSDTVVQKEIELYVENNNKIKELKEKKIDVSKAKWRLYFGK